MTRKTIHPFLLALATVLTFTSIAYSQKKTETAPAGTKPVLVVTLVIDQMRYDYLYRYAERYSETGFKRLLREGFSLQNAHYDYVPTHTAPGHACIATGCTPSVNGIIGNDWFDRYSGKSIYCVSDSGVKAVGTTSISGKMSPRNLLTTTFSDEIKLAGNFRPRVFGIALKDRGAILSVGHTADAAYWHDPYTNNWVSSSFYLKELPVWVQEFNKRKISDSLLSTPWNTLFPIETYIQSDPDDSPYEGLFKGETRPVFPHDLPKLRSNESELIRKTPGGNTFTRMFAEACIAGENLGKGKETDCITVSFSTPDYIGHMYGLMAIELEDNYLRLDRELGQFFEFLDRWAGKGNYLLILTADHGASHNSGFLADHKIPAAFIDRNSIADSLRNYLEKIYGDSSILQSFSSASITLDRNKIALLKLKLEEVQATCARFMEGVPGVAMVATANDLSRSQPGEGLKKLMFNGFNLARSGDVLIQFNPAWLAWNSKTGTHHHTCYAYDTHVPLIFFGAGIQSGSSAVPVAIKDIASTICTLLNIPFPNGNTGNPILPVVKK